MTIHSINTISSYTTNFIKESVVPRLRSLQDHKIALIAAAVFVCLAGLAIWHWRRLSHLNYLEQQKNVAAGLGNAGWDLYQASKLDEAALKYQAALAICPEDSVHLTSYALVLQQQGNADEATKVLEKAFSQNLDPNPSHSLSLIFIYARALEAQGNVDEALKILEKAFSYMVNLHEQQRQTYMYERARLLKKQGKLEEAEKQYEKLFTVDIRYPLDDYLEVLRLQGKDQKAEEFEEDFLEKLKLQLGLDPSALDSYARILVGQGKLDEAAKIYEEILTIDQGSIFFMCYADLVLVKQGKLDEAAKLYEAWLMICRDNSAVNKGYANILRLQGKISEAKQFEDECLARDEALKIGYDLKQEGKLEEAAKEYEKLFTKGKSNSVFGHYVDILRLQGKVKEAEKFEEDSLEELKMRLGLDKDRTNPYALSCYGGLLHVQDKIEEAVKIYEEILTLDPKSFYVTNYAYCLVQQFKFDYATKLYEAALQIGKDNSEVNKGYANLLRVQGKSDEAKKFEDECKARENSPG